jgi:hypothetical protein
VRESFLNRSSEEIAWNFCMQSVHVKCKECVCEFFDLEKYLGFFSQETTEVGCKEFT